MLLLDTTHLWRCFSCYVSRRFCTLYTREKNSHILIFLWTFEMLSKKKKTEWLTLFEIFRLSVANTNGIENWTQSLGIRNNSKFLFWLWRQFWFNMVESKKCETIVNWFFSLWLMPPLFRWREEEKINTTFIFCKRFH